MIRIGYLYFFIAGQSSSETEEPVIQSPLPKMLSATVSSIFYF